MTARPSAHRAALAFAFLVTAAPGSSFAQQAAPPFPSLTYENTELAADALERANRRIRAGRGTLVGCSILLAGGITMVGIAAVPFPSCETCDDTPLKGLAVAGGFAMAGGLAGMIAGGVILADGKRAKKKLRNPQLILAPAPVAFRAQF